MSDALKLLNERLARGDISEDEYDRLRSKIEELGDTSEPNDVATEDAFDKLGKTWEGGIVVAVGAIALYFLWQYRPVFLRGQGYVPESLDEVYIKPTLFFIGIAISLAVMLFGVKKALIE